MKSYTETVSRQNLWAEWASNIAKSMTSEGSSTLLPANVDDLSGHERIRQRSDDSKVLKIYAQCPRVMQGSQEGTRATLCSLRTHFGANIPMKIV